MAENTCPICKLENLQVRERDGDINHFLCRRCGDYLMSGTASAVFKNNKPLDPRFIAWVREFTEERIKSKPLITSDTYEKIIDNLPTPTVTEKMYKLMKAYERRSKFPGFVVDLLPEFEYPLAWAAEEKEFQFLFRALVERNYLIKENRSSGGAGYAYISPNGWDYLERYTSQTSNSSKAFVAMSFSFELENVWSDGFHLAISRAGYSPMRVDKEPHNELIDLRIEKEIRESKFIIADLTQQKHGVYYEAGFAKGLGKTVIWTVREDDAKNTHFDTEHYCQIRWKTVEELRDKLCLWIISTVGQGPISVSSTDGR